MCWSRPQPCAAVKVKGSYTEVAELHMEPRSTATGKGLHALAKDGQCTTLNSMADGYAQSEECAQSGNVWEDSTPLLPTAVKRRHTFHTQPKWLSYTWSHEAQLQAKGLHALAKDWQRKAFDSRAGGMASLKVWSSAVGAAEQFSGSASERYCRKPRSPQCKPCSTQ